jgi:anti-sigma factor RsiW
MSSLIHDIENNEALLLLFLSGELSGEDRLEVEQLLAADAGLRDELARIASEYDFAMNALSRLDADRSMVAGENHAIRQAKRAMKQWQRDQQNRQPAAAPMPQRRFPVWAYPSAVAAMLLIGFLTYWGIAGDTGASQLASQLPKNGQPTQNVASDGSSGSDEQGREESRIAIVRAELLENSLRPAMTGNDQSVIDISAGEKQARTLVARAESSGKVDEFTAALLDR